MAPPKILGKKLYCNFILNFFFPNNYVFGRPLFFFFFFYLLAPFMIPSTSAPTPCARDENRRPLQYGFLRLNLSTKS
uniref:Uncharacterized protein n=1 Tax=Cannabis sativa TaxID=3483 RepID=A0A803R428_CANSA